MAVIRLFDEMSIDEYIRSISENIRQEIASSLDLIEKSPPDRVATQLASRYRLNLPEFHFHETKTKVQSVAEQDRGGIVMIDYVDYEIRFSGDEGILQCRPSRGRCQVAYPIEVGLSNSKISFYVNSQGSVRNEGQPRERVKRYAESVEDYINCSLESLKTTVDDWNNNLELRLLQGITSIKEQMQESASKRVNMEDDLNTFKKR